MAAVKVTVHVCLFEHLKFCRAPHELSKSWDVEYELQEEGYINGVKHRGIDPGYEILQVFTGPFECEPSESREDGARWRRRTAAFVVGARWRRFEFDGERFEAGHHG